MPDIDPLEALCRLICRAEGVDPDRESIGCGGLMPRDVKYQLWEARKRTAQAILDAGYGLIEKQGDASHAE